MLSFKKGETPTFKFTLNVPIGILGTPRCVIRQEEFIGYLETEINTEANALVCKLKAEDSSLLVGGFVAVIEHSWVDDLGNVLVFPPEEVMVENVSLPYQSFEELDKTDEDEGSMDANAETEMAMEENPEEPVEPSEPETDPEDAEEEFETVEFNEFGDNDGDDNDEYFREDEEE